MSCDLGETWNSWIIKIQKCRLKLDKSSLLPPFNLLERESLNKNSHHKWPLARSVLMVWSGLYKLCHAAIPDWRTWSKLREHGKHWGRKKMENIKLKMQEHQVKCLINKNKKWNLNSFLLFDSGSNPFCKKLEDAVDDHLSTHYQFSSAWKLQRQWLVCARLWMVCANIL